MGDRLASKGKLLFKKDECKYSMDFFLQVWHKTKPEIWHMKAETERVSRRHVSGYLRQKRKGWKKKSNTVKEEGRNRGRGRRKQRQYAKHGREQVKREKKILGNAVTKRPPSSRPQSTW